jgi:hypothetical protein
MPKDTPPSSMAIDGHAHIKLVHSEIESAPEGAHSKVQPKISGVTARWVDTTAIHG